MKPKRELQPEQAAAAYEINKHISVTAGPGSGKTTVLVERYLHILRQNRNLNIDQIVAITFTNRAANEMRERLRDELNLILQTAAPDDRRHWLNYKRTLDGAVITTIHGFCARLLREFPVEAYIDPQFTLLDEHRAAMLLESVVEEALNEFIRAGHIEISRLTLGVGRAKLAATLAQLYRDVRGQGLSFTDLASLTARSHATDEEHARAVAQLCEAMNDFLAVRRTTPAARANQSNAISSWSALQPALSSIPEVEGIADYCRIIESFRKARPSAMGAVKEHVIALDGLVWEKELKGRVPQVALDMFAGQYALEIALLLNRIDERLNEEKQKISGLDFDDLELRALELLKRPEVITRAAERYKFFLVDEFQDTNGLQRLLLERLALQRGRGDSANLFIVGDRKQSIYGFRGADVGVFTEMTKTLEAAGGESKPLLLNFRSQPPLIGFFNYLFERLFRPGEEAPRAELHELGYVAHEPSEPRRELRDPAPLVELMITTEASGNEDDPKAEQNSRELDAEQLALRIVSLTGTAFTGTGLTGTGLTGTGLTGTAGVSPASSNASTLEPVEPVDVADVAFNESGRDARGPSESGPSKYSDIAVLFRAMTHVQIYESTFRRANIPYQTILGRGFYERQEITDLIQLLRFLDNKTDELALAAVLRSPLCGISDNALLALRCAPSLEETETADADPLKHFTQTRRLYFALRRHREIAFISDDEHSLLDRAGNLIKGLIARQHHYSLSALLRFAVEKSEFETVIAATFDGAQKLANVQRLFTLAERFENSGHHLIRDFVRYVEEFEAIGSRESEGQIDEATNAVKLMTIHQAKGLEFPIVIIPDLQRWSKPPDSWVLLDRQGGLTMKVPDGRGKLIAGLTFNRFEQRHALREKFESMRLLYVAATRAQDRLILSGTTKELEKLGVSSGTWLNWIWQSLELTPPSRSGVVELTPDVQLQLTLNIADEEIDREPLPAPADGAGEHLSVPTGTAGVSPASGDAFTQDANEPKFVPFDDGGRDARGPSKSGQHAREGADSISEAFPLLGKIEPERDYAVHRFSVTQLINYQRCPRQYYFDRVLHAPTPDSLAVWNDAEAPEPPANLTATLKGAVIHRFCETFNAGEDAEAILRRSFAEVVRRRRAEIADRLVEIETEEAIAELLPLAQNYLASGVFERIERARSILSVSPALSPGGSVLSEPPASAGGASVLLAAGSFPREGAGLWSELSFRLRRPLGILSGAIDKLLITPAASGKGFDIEIIDFKTNRLTGTAGVSPASSNGPTHVTVRSDQSTEPFNEGGRDARGPGKSEQFAFDFSAPEVKPRKVVASDLSVEQRVANAAFDYQLQMQAYALAVRELISPQANEDSVVVSTLHFLDPNVEFHLPAQLLTPEACRHAIDEAMLQIVSSSAPQEFPVRPALHCRMCSFLGICNAGREFVRAMKIGAVGRPSGRAQPA